MASTVFDYILEEETIYQSGLGVPVIDGYEWSMNEHIKRSTLLKNSQYENSKLGDKPFRNIIRPILNVEYRAEGIDVKDIQPFVDNSDHFYKSFLVAKYHERWARQNDLGTFIDSVIESYIDYGGTLVKRVSANIPESVPLQRIAFCDQTDLLSSPICEKHMYTPDALTAMTKQHWNAEAIADIIVMLNAEGEEASGEKTVDKNTSQKAKTPGKYIEVYELHGVMPADWLEGGTEGTYVRQFHAVSYWKDKSGKKHGVSLFQGKEKGEGVYKAKIRDGIYGRALGYGGIEELFEPQVWINYSTIQVKEMLDVASVIVLQTQDKAFATRNKTTDLQKGEILVHAEGMPVSQVNIQPINMQLFNNAILDWENNARTTGSANDPLLGKPAAAGTPFASTALVNNEGHGLHDWRKGKIADFFAELYRDWMLADIVKDMNDGHDFSEVLSLDELQSVAIAMATNEVNEHVANEILKNKIVSPDQVAAMIESKKQEILKGGSKRFLSIIKDEFKNIPIDVEMNIAGKQKDLAAVSDKLTDIFRQIMMNPQVLQDPIMAKLFNNILEASGISPIDFGSMSAKPMPPAAATPAAPAIAPANPPAPTPAIPSPVSVAPVVPSA